LKRPTYGEKEKKLGDKVLNVLDGGKSLTTLYQALQSYGGGNLWGEGGGGEMKKVGKEAAGGNR